MSHPPSGESWIEAFYRFFFLDEDFFFAEDFLFAVDFFAEDFFLPPLDFFFAEDFFLAGMAHLLP